MINDLFKSFLHGVFSEYDDELDHVNLGNIIEVLTDYHANGSYKVLKENVEIKKEPDFAWLVRSTDFENNFQNDKRYITEHAYNFLKKTVILGGDIIMSKIGNAGKVYFMPEAQTPCSLAMNLFLIRVDSSVADNEYIYRFLNSVDGQSQISDRLNGVATQTITKESVRSIIVPLYPLQRQKELVVRARELESKIMNIEDIYKTKLEKLEELELSLLQKAFSVAFLKHGTQSEAA